jgi:hypothetical protein
MPLSYEDSIDDLKKHDKYFISGHGHISPNNFPSFWETWRKWISSSNKIFYRVPENVFIVNLINTQHTLEYFNELESNFINNYITAADNNENYIERILLTPNEEINEQFFKNKVVYTPGSCIIDTTLNFNAEFITGIFKFPNELFRYSKLSNEFADWDKHDPLPEDICRFKDIVNDSRFHDKNYLLSEIVNSIHKDGQKKIIIVSSCNPIFFNEEVFNDKLLNDIFNYEIPTNLNKKRLEMEFITALEECNKNCILYSNEFFTNKYTLYYNSGSIPSEFNVIHFGKKRARQEADKYIIEYGNTGKQPKLLGSSKMKLRSFVRKSDENYHPVLSTISETMNDGVYDKYYTYPEIKNYICKLTYEILDRTPLYIEKISRLKSQAKSKSPPRDRISHSRKRKRSDGRKRKSKKRSKKK